MKSIIAAKMSSMRKRSALSSSAASSSEVMTAREVSTPGVVPKEPSSHHGKMRLCVDGIDSSNADDVVEIVLCIAVDSLHVVTDIDNSILFDTNFGSMKEIVWDYSECSVCFVLDGEIRSPVFVFESTLAEVETQLTSALRVSGQQRQPEQVYVGVLVGRNLPSSPIHQRRASLTGCGVQQLPSLPAALRRELLANERPPRSISAREKLAMQFFRSGMLSFPCSINGDARGLKLDVNYLYVYPSPDGHDRTACLFSYQYEQVETCEVRGGTRLELRFRRSGAKQPTFIAFQSPDAQYIRDAIWYFQHGIPMDEYFRRVSTSEMPSTNERAGRPPRPPSGRRSSLKAFQDDNAVKDRVQSCCIVIGCTRRCGDLAQAAVQDYREVGTDGIMRSRKIWHCQEHASVALEPGSPPRSPSKRSRMLPRGKSAVLTQLLIHSKHYVRSVKYHGTLLKSGGKYQLTKSWNQKIVALVDTPLGGFLCYYDKLAHCPGQTESAPKERRIIDLSGVICVRREGVATTGSQQQPYAFDIVTVYRTWTFAASDLQEYEVWLSVLGEAIERQSSMAPDKPLRFPVKCLRDPLHNLPSRNDGTTTLEVSSNGVTVCSGTEGDSEVYNWYFTDIQKWSVAKQHDNSACCLISCAVDPIDPVAPNSAASPRYQDFLFHTPEAETICSTIEFFVGRCMAKLEVLGLMYMHAQQRQLSRRPSLEPPSQRLSGSTKVESDDRGKRTSVKEHTLAAVPLRPVGVLPIASDNECVAQTAPEEPYLLSQLDDNSSSSQSPLKVCAVATRNETNTRVVEESRPRYQSHIPAPIELEFRSAEVVTELAMADAATGAKPSPCKLEVDEVSPPLPISSALLSSTDSTNDDPSPPIEDDEHASETAEHVQCGAIQDHGECTSNSTFACEQPVGAKTEGDSDCDSLPTTDRIVVDQGDLIQDASRVPLPSEDIDDDSDPVQGNTSAQADPDGDKATWPPLVSVDDTSSATEGNAGSVLASCRDMDNGSVEGEVDGDLTRLTPNQLITPEPVTDDTDCEATLSGCDNASESGVDSDLHGHSDPLEASRDMSVTEGSHQEVSDSSALSTDQFIIDTAFQASTHVDEKTLEPDRAEVDLSSCLLLLSDQSPIALWPGGIGNYNLEEQADTDSDRFVSFQYCECTVGEVEDTTSVCGQVLDGAQDDARDCEEAFEDARCEIVDTVETSMVVLDGCSGNDEDSLVVLEDADSNANDIDAIGDFEAVHDPIDELNDAFDGEEIQLGEASFAPEH